MAERVTIKVKKDKIPRASMPEQEPETRARNFLEVPTGYTDEMAHDRGATVPAMQKARLRGGLSRGN